MISGLGTDVVTRESGLMVLACEAQVVVRNWCTTYMESTGLLEVHNVAVLSHVVWHRLHGGCPGHSSLPDENCLHISENMIPLRKRSVPYISFRLLQRYTFIRNDVHVPD